MTTAAQMLDLIDRTATYAPPKVDLIVNVKITDVRTRFGRVDVLITPLDGAGQAWVERDSVTVLDADAADSTVIGRSSSDW